VYTKRRKKKAREKKKAKKARAKKKREKKVRGTKARGTKKTKKVREIHRMRERVFRVVYIRAFCPFCLLSSVLLVCFETTHANI